MSEKKETEDYKRVISAVILKKIKADGNEIDIEEIYKQDDTFFSEFINAVIESNEHIKTIYADTSSDLSQIERFGKAYDEYIRGMGKKMAEAIKPVVESFEQLAESIDFSKFFIPFQETMKNIGKSVSESIAGITNTTQLIISSMEPFRQLSESIGRILPNIKIPNITEKEIDNWKTNYERWGELGWTVLPNAPFNLFKSIPEDENSAHKLAMSYCDNESMKYVFSGLSEKKIKKRDLESAIFCYNNKQYKACALLLFGVIDSKLIKAQPKKPGRKVGQGAAKALRKSIEDNNGEEELLFEALYQINLLQCLDTYFAYGGNFLKEPKVINRNYIDHGMNIRNVRKRDCVQLFLSTYNLCEILDEL